MSLQKLRHFTNSLQELPGEVFCVYFFPVNSLYISSTFGAAKF